MLPPLGHGRDELAAVPVADAPTARASGGRRPRETTVQRALLALLLAACLLGDWFQSQTAILSGAVLLRHLADSATHGAVAFCCWGVFLCELALQDRAARRTQGGAAESPAPYYRWLLPRCALSGVAAALLDVDHFIAAGSLSIAGATHLSGRPFGHAVTFIAVLVAAVRRYNKRRSAWTRRVRISFVVVSLLSHQLRDGFRRGLWFWPLGSTPPVPYVLYLVMEQGLPLVMAHWVLRVRRSRRGGDRGGGDDSGDGGDFQALSGAEFVKMRPRDGSEDDGSEDEDGDKAPLLAASGGGESSTSDDAPRAVRGELIV